MNMFGGKTMVLPTKSGSKPVYGQGSETEGGLLQQATWGGGARHHPYGTITKQAYIDFTLHNPRFERDRVDAALETEKGYDKELYGAVVGGERLKRRKTKEESLFEKVKDLSQRTCTAVTKRMNHGSNCDMPTIS
jgi:hypothetical protein